MNKIVRKVKCIETDEVFDSCRSAAKHFNIDTDNLRKVLQGKRNGIKGMHFCYLKDVDNFKPKEIKRVRRKFYCIETGITYDSKRQAAAATGIDATTIWRQCNGYASDARYHFCYEEHKDNAQIKVRSRKVRCLETGIIYSNATAASIILDIPLSSIQHVLSGIRNSIYDLHFEYVN